jgi:hypothetical protein
MQKSFLEVFTIRMQETTNRAITNPIQITRLKPESTGISDDPPPINIAS